VECATSKELTERERNKSTFIIWVVVYISTNLISALHHGGGVTGGKVSDGSMARVINDVVRICLTSAALPWPAKKKKGKKN